MLNTALCSCANVCQTPVQCCVQQQQSLDSTKQSIAVVMYHLVSAAASTQFTELDKHMLILRRHNY
jgi:hypothetical protein